MTGAVAHPPAAFDLPSTAPVHAGPPPKDQLQPPIGQRYYYDDVSLAGTCTLRAADFDAAAPPPYGLARMYQGFYAYVRDDSGQHYYAQRVLQGPMVARAEVTAATGHNPARDLEAAARSFSGYVHVDTSGTQWTVHSLGSPKRPRMAFRLDPTTSGSWSEEGLCQLELEVLGPALQIYHPDPSFTMYFLQLPMRVRGTIEGREVEGVGGVEQAWGNGGHNWMALPMYQRVEDQWILSVIEYADGERQLSTMFTSLDGRTGAGMQVDGRSARAVPSPDSDLVVGDDGQPTEVRWTFGDDERMVTELVTGTMASPRTPGTHHWQCGTSRPVDQRREIAWSFAFVESVPRAVEAVRTRSEERA